MGDLSRAAFHYLLCSQLTKQEKKYTQITISLTAVNQSVHETCITDPPSTCPRNILGTAPRTEQGPPALMQQLHHGIIDKISYFPSDPRVHSQRDSKPYQHQA